MSNSKIRKSTILSVAFFQALPAVALLATMAGCDLTGQYDKKFSQALEDARRRSAFDDHLHAVYTDIVDSARQPTGVKLRLPKKFDGDSKALAQNIIPGQAEVKGSSYVLMKELDDDAGLKAPCIVALVAAAKTDPKAESLQAILTKSMAATGQGAKWEDATFNTPAGQTVTLKRVQMEIPMPVPAEKGPPRNVPSRVEVYLADTPNNMIMISWVIPKPQAQKHALDEAIKASMGTLELPAGGGDAAGGAAPAPAAKAG